MSYLKITFTILFSICFQFIVFSQSIIKLENQEDIVKQATYLKNIFKFDDAIQMLEGTSNCECMELLAECYYQKGENENAINLYSILSDSCPDVLLYSIRKMQLFYRLRAYIQCINEGKIILQKDSIYAISSLVGDSYVHLNQPDSALCYYNHSMCANKSESTMSKIGKIYLDSKRYEEALALAENYLADSPNNETALILKGISCYLMDDYSSAADLFQTLKDSGNNTYQICYYLGMSCWHLDEVFTAEKALMEAWQLDSSKYEVAYTLASVESKIGRPYEQAVKPWLDKVMSMITPDPAILSYIYQQYGSGAYQKNNSKDALSWFKKAYELTPDNLSVIYTIAFIYERKHNYKTAIEWYETYLSKAKPDSKGAADVKKSIAYLRSELFMEEK